MSFRRNRSIWLTVAVAGCLAAGPVAAQQGPALPVQPPAGAPPSNTNVLGGQFLAGGVLGTSGWFEQTADGRTILFPQLGAFRPYSQPNQTASSSEKARSAMEAMQQHMIMPPVRGWYFIAPNGALIIHPVMADRKKSK